MKQEEIGFIGLGNMGGAIVRRMLTTGIRLVVFDTNTETLNRFRQAGASAASSAREVADRTSLVLVCLPTGGNPHVAQEISHGSAIKVYADLSTMRPATIRAICEIMSAQGISAVDAPVSGGVAIAERGELSLMMAGDDAAMDVLASSMATVASHIFRIGHMPGQAQLCKIVNNAIGFTVFVASCEALVTGAGAGIDPTVLLQAINAGSARNSWTTDKFAPHILSRRFDAGGKLGGGPRALDLYLEEAAALGMPSGLVARTRDVWAHIAEILDPTEDFTHMIQYFESYVGVELRARDSTEST